MKKMEKSLTSYECLVCGYIYDPAEGDSEGGITPNTPFEKLGDDWVCPVCGTVKTDFSEL